MSTTLWDTAPKKEVNEQTTAASITQEQEHEEWEENEKERREAQIKRAWLVLVWAPCGVCHGSVPQMKMRGEGGA